MSDPRKPIDDHSQTGEFETDEFSRSMVSDSTGTHRRRRRRKQTKSSSANSLLRALGLVFVCVVLVSVGIFVGLSQRPNGLDGERAQATLEKRLLLRHEWLSECGENGHSEWTCNKFDRAHFEVATKLDRFECESDQKKNRRCHYTLGDAHVVLIIPIEQQIDGDYRASRRRPRAIIDQSSRDNEHYIGVSAGGRIEIRKQNLAPPLFVINPATGALHAVHGSSTSPVEE